MGSDNASIPANQAINVDGESIPAIHVISDSMGLTGSAVARAAAAQFGLKQPKLEVFSEISTVQQLVELLDNHTAEHVRHFKSDCLLVFYTLVDSDLSNAMAAYVESHSNIIAVDIMGQAVEAIAKASGTQPSHHPGIVRAADEGYFKRIEAVEFTIDHDDGKNPQDLGLADIVLIGTSRTSKTPLSIYLSQLGYKVSNIPLDLNTEPPAQLFEVQKERIFGLLTTPDALIGIRQRRIGKAGAAVSSYADPEFVIKDLEKARMLMRKLGCVVIHTENRAVEEAAQEVLRYYKRSFPQVIESTNPQE